MDLPDSKACEIKNDAELLYSLEKLDNLAKEKGSSNSCKKFTDENMVLEKQGHLSDQEINSCEADSLPAKENCLNYDHVSASDCTKGDVANNLKQQFSAVSTSTNLVAEVGMCEKKICAEGFSGATSCSNGYASSTVQSKLACDGNPKDGEVSTDGIDFAQRISVKSDISSETEQFLNRESNESDVGRTHGNWLNAGEDGLKSAVLATFHDIQHKTESSSSNSTHVILPVSSSKCSYQEMSVEAKSSKYIGSGMKSSICMDFKCSVEEPAARSVVLGMAAKIAQRAVDNVRARDSKKMLGMIRDQNSMIDKKVDIPESSLSNQKNAELLIQHEEELSYELGDTQGVVWKAAREVEQKVGFYREASGSTSSIDEKNGETARLSSVDSADPNKNNCSIESRKGIKLCQEEDNRDSFHSYEEVMDPETPVENKHFLAVKGQSQGLDPAMMHEANDDCHGHESSQLTRKPEIVPVTDQTPVHSTFDLNEDIHANEVECPTQLVDGMSSDNVVNVSTPIPVMAKSGIPVCLPVTSMKLVGELGWKGSAATSAFRPASLFKNSNRNTASFINDNNCSSKHSQVFSVIDLNVAAVEDDSAMELPRERVAVPSGFPFNKSSAEVSSKRVERLDIDLNCLGENDDDCLQSSLPVSLSRHATVDFDLNYTPSLGDTCNDARWPGQGSQPLRNKALDDAAFSFVGNSRQPDFNCVRPAYWGDFSSIQGFSHGHAQPFMVAAAPNVLQSFEQMQRVVTLQPKLPYTPQTFPSHGYPYNNAFCIGPADPLSSSIHSSGVLPYITDPRGTTVIPQILGPGTLPAFHGAPHLMDTSHGPIPSDIANIRPTFDVNYGENSSENGSRGGNTRQFLYPARNSLMEEHMKSFQQVALSSTPVKRREPEGGWDSYQLGYRQVTSWH